jgi:anti-sigma B factor antagonist
MREWDPGRHRAPVFAVHDEGATRVVVVTGELDATEAEVLAAVVDVQLRGPGVAATVLDLAAVTFMGSRALGVLLAAHGNGPPRVPVRVVATAGGRVRRLLRLTGFERVLDVYPTRAAALAVDRAAGT